MGQRTISRRTRTALTAWTSTGSGFERDAFACGTTAPCYSEAEGRRGEGGGRVKQQPSGNLLWARRIKVTVGHGGDTEEKMVTVEKEIKKGKRGERAVTSILRPSTSVPWSFSLALSASALDSNVTKPKPCKRRVKKRQGDAGGGGEGDCS